MKHNSNQDLPGDERFFLNTEPVAEASSNNGKDYSLQPYQIVAMLETISEAFFALDRQWKFTYLNRRAETLLRHPRAELVGRNIWQEFPEAVNTRFYNFYQQAMTYQKPAHFEEFYPPFDIWFEVRAYPTSQGLLIYCQDITAQKQAQAQLQKLAFTPDTLSPALAETVEEQVQLAQTLGSADQDLQLIVARNMAEGVCIVRAEDTVILYANPKFERMFGYGPGELNNQPARIINYQDATTDPQEVAEELLAQIEAHGEATYEVHNVKKDGTDFWCQATTTIIEHPAHGTILVAVQQDITERKRLEEQLRQSREVYRNLVRNLPDSSVILFDQQLRYIVAAGASLVENGFNEREIEGRTLWEVLPREAASKLLPYYQAALAGIEHTFEDSYNERSYLIRAVPVRNEQGQIFAGMMLSQDVTPLKQAEQRALLEKERLDVTLRSIGDAVITTDLNGQILLMNTVAEELTGWSQNEAAGHYVDEVFRLIKEKNRQPTSSPVRQTLLNGQVVQLANHLLLVARDGTERSIADSSAPIRDRAGSVIGAVLVFRDVTREHRLTEELLRASKLEALAILAGGIAHDFNNLLTVILGNLNLAKLEMNKPFASPLELKNSFQEVLELVEEAERATLRSRDITQQLLTFAKGGAPIKKPTNLAEVVRESANFALHGTNVDCQFNFQEALWAVEVDEGQLSQVIQNLVLNAVQAFPPPPLPAGNANLPAQVSSNHNRVEITGQNIRLAENQVVALTAGYYVHLQVKDNGSGIRPENLVKVFDPFFTTKEKGSGLGLAVCYSVIRRHDGLLTVESQVASAPTEPHGTTFNIYLPALPNTTYPPVPASSDPALENTAGNGPVAPIKKGRILVMDDETSLRQLARRLLERLGYAAETAATGEEAIDLYQKARAEDQAFNLILLDLTVPGGMAGQATLQRLKELDPAVKAVVCSGYSNSPVMANWQEYGFSGILVKPYTLEALRQILEELIP